VSQQRNDLCPFKSQSGTLRVVLVIGVGRRRRLDDGVEVVVKCLTKRECPEPFGRQYLPHGHGWSSGPVRVRFVHDPSTSYVPLGIPMQPPTEAEHLGSHLGHRAAPAVVELEVLLGVMAADAASTARERGQYLHGAWAGAFTWRRRYGEMLFEQQIWDRRRDALLGAGMFGGDAPRANRAFDDFAAEAKGARSRRT
jgi:hypothetical protein